MLLLIFCQHKQHIKTTTSFCDSKMLSALNVFVSHLFDCNLKEKGKIRRKINSKKVSICGISIIILICQKSGLVGPVNKK